MQDGIAYLMHPETFEQLEVDAKVLGTAGLYLPADAKVKVSLDNGAVHSITPYSETAVLEVVDTDAYSADVSPGRVRRLRVQCGCRYCGLSPSSN